MFCYWHCHWQLQFGLKRTTTPFTPNEFDGNSGVVYSYDFVPTLQPSADVYDVGLIRIIMARHTRKGARGAWTAPARPRATAVHVSHGGHSRIS